MENMKKTAQGGYYKGDPIWNIYKRHGGRTACIFWSGCAHNISGRPDISPPYNKGLPFRHRFDMILNWLLQPESTRPGLITAYLDQPDSAGHYYADVSYQLTQLDNDLRYLIQRLDAEDLLPCINLVLVSDQGMQKLNNTHYLSQLIPDQNVLTASGVIGRVHKYKSDANVDDLMKPFACEKGNRWKVFSRNSMPTRKHYQKTARVGDIIVQGEPGTSFYSYPSWDLRLYGDHGYDFINPTMHTIFFAMGPSIKKGVVVPGFQIIEYFNLFLDLLGVPENVPNNGTVGLLDGILTNPPQRSPRLRFPFLPLFDCSNSGFSVGPSCRSCSLKVKGPILAKLMCLEPQRMPFQILSKPTLCYQDYCGNTLITDREENAPVGISEILTTNGVDRFVKEFCYSMNSKYGGLCGSHTDREGSTLKSLSAEAGSEFSGNGTERIPWKSKFITDVLDPLNKYTRSLTQRMGRVISITGTAFDFDYDGIADEKRSSSPSHLYRILVTCSGPWSQDNTSCLRPSDLKVLSFIFPHMDGDINCLTKDDLLLEYTARLLDVELISGLRLIFPNVSHEQYLRLETHINTKLW
ncbi:Ectonucleotide pyrophosphatase/phosphodiesterase C27A7.1 [Trichostrongylus colubriformis]|uniref:Ectonucleotide pyrophosphatase/phosphodiesterase C27A7.1 n=1 Tax=Trichostrongylus colubriformis TaxID=6319 RepID=A0AAN8IR31_TRICO